VLEVYRAADELQSHFRSQGWRFCLIGGIALQRWGEPRETIDVDVTLLAGFGHEEGIVRTLLSWYRPRVAEPLAFALSNRVLTTASAEDIVIMKAFAARPKDWIDVEGIVIRQGVRTRLGVRPAATRATRGPQRRAGNSRPASRSAIAARWPRVT
jgi:hypothetical protein